MSDAKRENRREKRKRLIKQLDSVFSICVRTRDQRLIGMCRFCGKPIEDCFHVVTRAKHVVRWDLGNAVGSCRGCNLENEYNPDKFRISLIRSFGLSWYSDLVERSNRPRPMPNEELEDILNDIKGQLATGKIYFPGAAAQGS